MAACLRPNESAHIMNEEPKEKPIRELLQDITRSGNGSRFPPGGLVLPKLVDRITFFASIVPLLLITSAPRSNEEKGDLPA
jgi:hypothetical protein